MWKIAALASLLLAPLMAQAEEALFDAQGYCVAHYRGTIPAPPEGVRRISVQDLARLRPDADVLLVDVLPGEGGHRDEDGTWHLASPRLSLRVLTACPRQDVACCRPKCLAGSRAGWRGSPGATKRGLSSPSASPIAG